MRIRSLSMESFRGFEAATLDLDRPLTVLFGVNGSGKSSVLMAVALALSPLVEEETKRALRGGVDPERARFWCHWIDETDIRRGATRAIVRASLTNGAEAIEVASNSDTSASADGIIRVNFIRFFHAAPFLCAFYEAVRDVANATDAFSNSGGNGTGGEHDNLSTGRDELVAGRSRFRSFFRWFKQREDIENELKVSQQNLSLEDPQLSAVRRAIASMLPGFAGLRIQRDPLHMVIRKGDQLLAVDQLSDGEKLLLALTADLARRLAMTYPDLADPLQGEAVVLIDEIELHLHPSWQRRALGALRRTFPNCQLIVTTHSPQVLSEVPNDAVVLVKDFQFFPPGAPTAGRDSNAILAEAMETPERPAAQMDTIRAIAALIDEGKLAEARAKLDSLAREVTERDREVVGLRTMLHFLGDGDEAHPQGP